MTCSSISVLGDSNYTAKLHLIFYREWTRAHAGDEAVQRVDEVIKSGGIIDVPDSVLEDIDAALVAMSEGGDTVPGVWSQHGDCYQDWTVTACFARWYMQQSPEKKERIREELRNGNFHPWTELDDNAVVPCGPEAAPSSSCCPSSVWADPAYLELTDPEKEGRWPWWSLGLAAIGIGLTAAWVKAKW